VTFGRGLLVAVLLGTAVVLQTVVLSPLRLPGATPDVVLLVVVALALVQGPTAGLIIGFAGGLLLDIVPPASGALGRWALVLCLVGLVAGRLRDTAERSVFLPIVIVAGCSVLATVGYAATGVLVGDPGVSGSGVFAAVPAALLYDVLLSPFIVPGVMLLARRFEVSTTYARGRR